MSSEEVRDAIAQTRDSITFGTDVVIKAYGQKRGLAANAVSCTVTDPLGTITVVRVPVPPKG